MIDFLLFFFIGLPLMIYFGFMLVMVIGLIVGGIVNAILWPFIKIADLFTDINASTKP